MKNVNVFLNIILIVAVSVLYYLHFNADKCESKKNDSVIEKRVINNSNSADIAFIDLEKLLVEYELSKEMNSDFTKRKEETQSQLELQFSAFEKDAKAFQEKMNRGGFLSQKSAENQQNILLEKQQELQVLQIDLENKLREEQQNLNIQLYDSVMNYLKIYNDVKNFSYVFSKMDGGNLLIGDSAYEITNHVIEALNNRYQQAQK